MTAISSLKTKIYADGADFDSIMKLAANPVIKGFTTNPTLMRKAGIEDYEKFARKLLSAITDRPISFEVFSDDLPAMEKQARIIAGWGKNINVKIPVTNTLGEFTGPVIERLSADGINVNVTAVFTLQQVRDITTRLSSQAPAIISVFAGRVADTGVDPLPIMRESLQIMSAKPRAELIWASPRELLNIIQANDIGCHIITVTHDILGKLGLIGKSLEQYSLETVQMFHRDAAAAGYDIT